MAMTLRIVVTGWAAPFPLAGFLWHPLSFALGFRDLGHEVWYLEDSGDQPWGYDPVSHREDASCSAGVGFLGDELAAVGLGERWTFRHATTGRWFGMSEDEARAVLASADVLVNVSLTTQMRPEYLRIPHRLAIDTDPVFTQIRMAQGDAALASAPHTHTRLFTFGRPPLPAQSHEWVPTRQAVATRLWPVAPPAGAGAPFTSVTSWKAYPAVTWDLVEYGAKDRSFCQFADLPSKTRAPLEISLGGGANQDDGAEFLHRRGWRVGNPIAATHSTEAYRQFISDSAGELGFAKHGYVAARSGWFSERTCCYLASGRPAVIQDTGWTDWLPSGEGVLPFATPNEAVAALEAVVAEPDRHGRAARKFVEEHFEAGPVCAALLEHGL
jgi:hypothetical protein